MGGIRDFSLAGHMQTSRPKVSVLTTDGVWAPSCNATLLTMLGGLEDGGRGEPTGGRAVVVGDGVGHVTVILLLVHGPPLRPGATLHHPRVVAECALQ